MSVRILWSTLLSLSFACMAATEQAAPYIINVSESIANPGNQAALERLYQRLYQPLGIVPLLTFHPSKRGLALLADGQLDADAARVAEIIERYPELVKIEPPLFTLDNGYYCAEAKYCERITQDTVLIVPKGTPAIQHFCEEQRLSCLYVNNDQSAFKALESGVGEALLSFDWGARTVICSSRFRRLFYRPEPRLRQNVYHFVSSKHAGLADKLSQVIQTMAQNGDFNDFYQFGMERHLKCGAQLLPVTIDEVHVPTQMQ
ncbi:hypothetical protein ACFOEE_10510 [Pseudoalteromonas fenneropenaei]|uniref:ABC transporter substrate-binding protein n=1 Tax=Pseudoalteromonas fenneropenaei TaxID=1737459 RepID=A0ABV7CK04_9GAMM